MAGLEDYLNRLGRVPDSIDTRRVPFGAETRAPAAPNLQPYLPTAQQAIQQVADQNPTRNNPGALRMMETGNKPQTFESAAKKVNFGLNPEIAAGQLESQLKFDTSRLSGFNPTNQPMQGGPNFVTRGQPTNVPNFEMQGKPNFPLPSTEVLSRDLAKLPPVDVSSKPNWENLRGEYNAPKYGANLGAQMGQGYAPATDTLAGTPVAQEAGTLRKLAGAIGAAGTMAQGGLPTLGGVVRGGIPAYLVANTTGQLGSMVSDIAAGRTNPTIEAGREARAQTYRDLAAGNYGHALGSGLRASAQAGGQVLSNIVSPFGDVARGLFGAPVAGTAAAAPAAAPLPAGAMSAERTPGAPALTPSSGTPAAQPGAPAGPKGINVYSPERGWVTYDVSPGAPIGKIMAQENPASVMARHQMDAYSDWARNMGRAYDQQWGPARRENIKAIGSAEPHITYPAPEKAVTPVPTRDQLMREAATRGLELAKLEAGALAAEQAKTPDAAQLRAYFKQKQREHNAILQALSPSAGIKAEADEALYGGQ